MNNEIIMYHYVRDNTKLKAFSTRNFRKQVELIAEKYTIVSLQNLIEKNPEENTCVLTFDDGIKDGYTNVFPILQELGVKATFFIPTRILVKKKIIAAQKNHLLLAKLGTSKLVEEWNTKAEEQFQIKKDGKKNQFDDDLTSSLKNMIYTTPKEKCRELLNPIFDKHFNEEEFETMYLSTEELKEMEKNGMEIGSHGHAHLWLGKVSNEEMKKDLSESVKVFENVFSRHPKVIAYPFGSYSQATLDVAKKLGFIAGVTTKNEKNLDLNHPLKLNRFDCIERPPSNRKLVPSI